MIVDYLKDNGGEAPWLTLRDDLLVTLDTIKRMIAKGILTVSQAAELSGMTVEEFEKKAAALA